MNVGALLAATVLVFGIAGSAPAYTWSPAKASVRLHGKLTFTPNEGGQPFKCSVTMDFKTKPSRITAVKFPRGDCKAVHFIDFPWNVAIIGTNSGNIGGGSFGSSGGTCVQGANPFQVNGFGIWTLSGGCLVGTLTSSPTTTIVP